MYKINFSFDISIYYSKGWIEQRSPDICFYHNDMITILHVLDFWCKIWKKLEFTIIRKWIYWYYILTGFVSWGLDCIILSKFRKFLDTGPLENENKWQNPWYLVMDHKNTDSWSKARFFLKKKLDMSEKWNKVLEAQNFQHFC